MGESQNRTLRQRLSNTFNSIFKPDNNPFQINPVIQGVSQNQIIGGGVQQLTPVQSTSVNRGMNRAAFQQATNPTALERFSQTVGDAVTSFPSTIRTAFENTGTYLADSADAARNLGQQATEDGTFQQGNIFPIIGGAVDKFNRRNDVELADGDLSSEIFNTDFSFGDRPVIDYQNTVGDFDDSVGTFRAATDAVVDREFNKFLTDAGYTQNAEGRFVLDTEIFGEQKDLLGRTFEQLKEQFKVDYDRIREDLQKREERVDRGFRQSQQAMSEQAFLGQRQMQAALAGRGLGGSGIAQLGGVQQQIARGQQMSNLAAEYTELQQSIMTEGTRASENLSSKLEQADLQLAQGVISISDKQRQEENAFNQYLAETKSNLRQAIDSRNFQQFSAEVARYQAATEASAAEFNKRVTLANMDLSNLYDDFSSRMEQLQVTFAATNQSTSRTAEFTRLANTLRQQYEAERTRITNEYGLRG